MIVLTVVSSAVTADDAGRVTIGDTTTTARDLFRSLRGGAAAKSSDAPKVSPQNDMTGRGAISPAADEGRDLLRALRSGATPNSLRKTSTAAAGKQQTRPPVPPIPSGFDTKGLRPVPALRVPADGEAGQGIRVRSVSAQDMNAGHALPVPPEAFGEDASTTPPMMLANPPKPFVAGGQASSGTNVSEGCCEPNKYASSSTFFGVNRSSAARQLKRQANKLKRQARRASRPFVAWYEPEDVDDYDMPILLVGNEEEVRQPEPQTSGLLARKLSHIKPTLDYAWGEVALEQLPDDFHQTLDNGPYVERYAPRKVVQWAPTNLWYYPLYFEDPQLERYGHTSRPWLQPFVSSGRFMVQTIGLPYQMTLHPPHCREYALGYYQPGEWAPKKKYQIPWNEEAAATEFLWVMGFVLLVP